MATIENKEAVDKIIKDEINGTRKEHDSTCLRIVQYDNKWKNGVFGLIFDGDDLLAYHNSPYCYNVEIYWENPKISFKNIKGKYLILRPNEFISASQVRKKINATEVCYLQVASCDAEDFCEIMGDAYMQVKDIEFYCEEIQIFKVIGDVNSSMLQKELKEQFIGALEFHHGDYQKFKKNVYTKNISEKEKSHEYIKNALKNAW